ncbi:MAG: radical SAM protein [Planctomycetes bacterium]|nr:radical SAM protein [Planctomycetota bacterium]
MHRAELRLVFWETTVACHLACRHCRRQELAVSDELDTAEGRALIDAIAELGRPILVFSGGEPLQRPDLFDLLAHARARALPCALATTGTLIDDALAERLAACGLSRVAVSLDGADAATHDDFRGRPGAFAAAVAGLQRLRAHGISTQINCTLARHNVAQLPRLRELALALGAAALHVFVIVPVGCGAELDERQRLTAEEVEAALGWLADQAEDRRLFVKATCAPQFARVARQRRRLADLEAHARQQGALHATTRGCLAGSAVCFVSARGEVYPCGYLPLRCGSVREASLAAIWRASPVFAALRDPEQLRGACGACAYRDACGGCRARAAAVHGDWLGSEPDCVLARMYDETACVRSRKLHDSAAPDFRSFISRNAR